MKLFFQLAFTLIFAIIMMTNCGTTNSDVAVLHAKKCLLQPIDSNYSINNVILFPDSQATNQKKIELPISSNNNSLASLDICRFFRLNNINIDDIALVSVIMHDAQKNTQAFVITSEELSVIGKDTLVVIKESTE